MTSILLQSKVSSLYINDSWVETDTHFKNYNPSTLEVINLVGNADVEHVDQAIQSAQDSLKSWRILTPKQRNQYIIQFLEELKQDRYNLAEIISLEQGKPFKEAIGEIDKCLDYINYFTEENLRINNYNLTSDKKDREITVKYEPIGVVAAITPWNLPVGMVIRKIIPALCVGCTVILKPSAETPLSAIKLVEYFSKTLPKGVLNLITTNKDEEVGRKLATSKKIDLLTFTGSSSTGKKIISESAITVKKLILELGGNAPFIIFKDADINKAAEDIIETKFRNAGQTCTSVNRLYIEETIADEFIQLLVTKLKKLKIGNGLSNDYDIGPLINNKAINKVKQHLEDALLKGANIIYRGSSSQGKGYFFEPTLIENVNSEMKVVSEETFGPILPILKFNDFDNNIVEEANDCCYGLCAYIYTNDLIRAKKIANELDYGIVGINNNRPTQINAPFGGFKESGYGKECGREGLLEFMRLKSVYLG
ncbi:NAD-dependent succinate-semialdehyde dehydrogenase [Bacillus cereus group sp. BfR-BA-01380]|uniref:NAD-dependent succinate-semialdehyde dehydrogenase n=1 Tax=Bacillus cereus group sp. BfR-BA-01380 TaxID=2920324 RepID=UPI001F5980C6|nr:NAD-dependent succinate-semialdehyde dehydrogenase [Bacillus cereus group sp. BfR-BA-01380]